MPKPTVKRTTARPRKTKDKPEDPMLEAPIDAAGANGSSEPAAPDAEAANTVLELRPCQRMIDYSFKYAPAAKKKAEGSTQ